MVPQFSADEEEDAKQAALLALMADAGLAGKPQRIVEMSAGFCNWVYRVDLPAPERSPIVVKIFSPLAKLRLEPAARGLGDQTAAAEGLGPQLLYRSPDGLITDFVHGDTLAEADMHAAGSAYPAQIAPRLAALHRCTSDECAASGAGAGTSALWTFLQRMVDHIATEPGSLPRGISMDDLRREVGRMRARCDALALPMVLGHGDLKPSNVMLGADGAATFIDFELAGPNYRGYDIFKLFRTAGPSPVSDQNLGRFVEAYLGETASASAVDHVRLETRLFEPLTWLEAAIFFSFASVQLPEKRSEMAALAADRWRAYEAVAGGAFDANVRALERHAAVERRPVI